MKWKGIKIQLLERQMKRLEAERNRTGSTLAELIRRAIDAMYPPPEEKK
jgi:hypothetical protein